MSVTTISPVAGTSLLVVGPDTWRAVDQRGRALGNVRLVATPAGERFTAMRFHPPTRSFRAVGDFWSRQEAIDALRYGR